MIIAIIVIAISKYARNDLFTVVQKRYKKEAITNFEASKVDAMIITATAAPANNLDKPTIEKKAAQPARESATNPTNILRASLFIRF